ncbi:MAG TPA: DUF1737 domain-containing protein [Trebonia sp.]|jgi:hypothetical protein|nr:DUF1737 domain-containing protein [Trebonia sp.]
MSAPPDGLPAYRVLTGPDDAAFCHRVSEAIALGYRLHGGPAVTFNGERVIVAQALLWPGASWARRCRRQDGHRLIIPGL